MINIPRKAITVSGLMLFAILMLLAYLFGPNVSSTSSADIGPWYSVAPPILAVIVAFMTRKLFLSLGLAILAGGILAVYRYSASVADALLSGPVTAVGYLFGAISGGWNLQVLAFVFIILSMISVMVVSGGFVGVVAYLTRFTKTRRSTKFMTAIMGLIIFIDDYANTMIVGSSMRPISDLRKISREKLAFIIDSTSAPVAGLAIVSTWIGFEVGLFGEVSESLELGVNGYSMFFDAIAFRFYCVLMLLFVFINILSQSDFGPMLSAERKILQSHGKQTANPKEIAALNRIAGKLSKHAISALLPLLVLMSTLLTGLWWDGGGFVKMQTNSFAWLYPTVWLDVIANTKNNTSILVLASFFGLLTAGLCAAVVSKIKLAQIRLAMFAGFKAGLLPAAILILAWALKSSCDDLATGEFLAASMGQAVSPFLFPFLVFLTAAIVSFGTGTSWGTMSILIPTAIPVAYALDGNTYGLITIISLGAILDGAIFGDHCSPISDTTIMSSIASSCDHIEHVRTQLPYSLLVGLIAMLFGYLPAAFGVSPLICFAFAIAILSIVFFFLSKKVVV